MPAFSSAVAESISRQTAEELVSLADTIVDLRTLAPVEPKTVNEVIAGMSADLKRLCKDYGVVLLKRSAGNTWRDIETTVSDLAGCEDLRVRYGLVHGAALLALPVELKRQSPSEAFLARNVTGTTALLLDSADHAAQAYLTALTPSPRTMKALSDAAKRSHGVDDMLIDAQLRAERSADQSVATVLRALPSEVRQLLVDFHNTAANRDAKEWHSAARQLAEALVVDPASQERSEDQERRIRETTDAVLIVSHLAVADAAFAVVEVVGPFSQSSPEDAAWFAASGFAAFQLQPGADLFEAASTLGIN
jgi:hypothetical protein